MSSTSTDSNPETEITLYNPSSEKAEELDPGSLDRNVLDIEIDRGLAERLLEVSKHLGLNPTIVASRAIDLVCEEIGTLDEDWRDDEDEFGTVTLIQRYQARVDLLQALKEESDEVSGSGSKPARKQQSAAEEAEAASDDEEEELWEAVDEIKNVLDEVDEAVDSTKDASTSDEGFVVKDEESPPTAELTVDQTTLEKKEREDTEDESDEESSRWNTVTRIMSVFSSSDERRDDRDEAGKSPAESSDEEESVPTDAVSVDETEHRQSEGTLDEPYENASIGGPKEDESPPTAEFTIDEEVQDGEALETDDVEEEDSEEDVTRSKDWDAVESIIEEGEQARG